MIEAVLLDAGGVLVLPEHEHIVAALRLVGIDAEGLDLDLAHYVGLQAVDASYARAEQEFRGYFAACASYFCTDGDRVRLLTDELTAAWERLEWTNVIEGTVDALRRLTARGMRLAVVSNSNGTVESKLRTSGVCQVGPGDGVDVQIVVDSHIVGFAKPDPRIFAIALEALDIGPQAAVHVGDALHSDVAGARAAGIMPMHFDPYELCGEVDHEHVRSLEDVAELIDPER